MENNIESNEKFKRATVNDFHDVVLMTMQANINLMKKEELVDTVKTKLQGTIYMACFIIKIVIRQSLIKEYFLKK